MSLTIDEMKDRAAMREVWQTLRDENDDTYTDLQDVADDFDDDRVTAQDVRHVFTWYGFQASARGITRLASPRARGQHPPWKRFARHMENDR